jgi:NAD(P)-dependent dehydrogenase (short-subunit alcohol dehydrogenase family)
MSVILITGTSTGIGCAIAELLARNKHIVYATMRNPHQSTALQELAKKENLRLHVLQLDVLDDDSVNKAIATVLSKENHIDVLVNNAGIHSWGAVEELPMELFKANMDTNYFGALRCIKAVLPSMRKNKSGSIINITSIAGKIFFNFHGAYAASKAALEALSESLAQEVAPYNIKVFLVEPGITKTPIFSKVNKVPENTIYPNVKRFMSIFAASLENPISTAHAAEVVNEIVSGKRNTMRNPAGTDAEGFLAFRASMKDEDWVNSVMIDDETWMTGMEQMGFSVRKFMQAETLPEFNH